MVLYENQATNANWLESNFIFILLVVVGAWLLAKQKYVNNKENWEFSDGAQRFAGYVNSIWMKVFLRFHSGELYIT